MRPNTLSQAYERIIGGQPQTLAFAEFLDFFYLASDMQQRSAALADEPPLTGNDRLDALAGATAEYLAKLYQVDVPAWAGSPSRYLAEPWFTAPSAEPALVEYLVHCSPSEFRSRNIFTEERPLRRASQPRTMQAAE